jgi:hypothetical protein
MQHGPAGRTRPEPGQAREKLDELFDFDAGGHRFASE